MAAPAEAVNGAALATMHHDLSMWGLFMQSDVIVKCVILMLLFASVWVWTIVVSKRMTLNKLNRRATRFEEAFWSGEPLEKLYTRVKKNPADPLLVTFTAGMEEWQTGVAAGIPSTEALQTSLKQRIERAMSASIQREMHRLERGMTFLASVGSSATFVGLFGTVWGIMRSFTAIANSNNTSLAVVAPGIAEALFATAIGLVAAIPAMIAYNVFATLIARYADRLETFSSDFLAVLSRHLDSHDRGGGARGQKVA
ncbi:MAG: protein TolQ [Alphaproteobacteria bacterium]|nr:protein TolQ [Alphaproteobacteria bacterium]